MPPQRSLDSRCHSKRRTCACKSFSLWIVYILSEGVQVMHWRGKRRVKEDRLCMAYKCLYPPASLHQARSCLAVILPTRPCQLPCPWVRGAAACMKKGRQAGSQVPKLPVDAQHWQFGQNNVSHPVSKTTAPWRVISSLTNKCPSPSISTRSKM